jgi:hypothetical protein
MSHRAVLEPAATGTCGSGISRRAVVGWGALI